MARSAILSIAAVTALVAAVAPDPRVRPEPSLSPSERVARVLAPVGDLAVPPLPVQSTRTADYEIDATLDPAEHTLTGRLILRWTNPSSQAVSRFPFHLYWNAYRNTVSTVAREARLVGHPRLVSNDDEEKFGFIQIRTIHKEGEDLTPTLTFVHPDDDNEEDRTLVEAESAEPVAPGETARFEIEWVARLPHGSLGRSGYIRDEHFVAQWFPKISGFASGAWNRHQFHALGEFFSNFGTYDVRLTLPRGFEVGATGRMTERKDHEDGTTTLRFVQEDVHDFAWTASRRSLVRTGRFEAPGYPPVELRLLIQPEHRHLAPRYLEAARVALLAFGAWSAPYPYRQLTIVDPVWGSASGGMEYPTLFTVGGSALSPKALLEPESVTLHECAHQFWHGLVATNELEEPWLDEGFATYHAAKALSLAYGPEGQGRRYFGLGGGWPIVAPGVSWGRGDRERRALREGGEIDPMRRLSWEYRNGSSYRTNAYAKPALLLQTIEGLVGDEEMTRILRTYARRFRFGHPKTSDFTAVVEEVTGRSWKAFFEQTIESSAIVDYAVGVRHLSERSILGYDDVPGGAPARGARELQEPASTTVVILRRGGARLPVELLVAFADGHEVRETWDGQDRSRTFRYVGQTVVAATVDPDNRIALDVDRGNNRWSADEKLVSREAARGTTRFLFFLQNLLLTQEVLG